MMRKLFLFFTLLLCFAPIIHAKIVFYSAREICVMEDDGSRVRVLTHNDVYDASPRWSPNGK